MRKRRRREPEREEGEIREEPQHKVHSESGSTSEATESEPLKGRGREENISNDIASGNNDKGGVADSADSSISKKRRRETGEEPLKKGGEFQPKDIGDKADIQSESVHRTSPATQNIDEEKTANVIDLIDDDENLPNVVSGSSAADLPDSSNGASRRSIGRRKRSAALSEREEEEEKTKTIVVIDVEDNDNDINSSSPDAAQHRKRPRHSSDLNNDTEQDTIILSDDEHDDDVVVSGLPAASVERRHDDDVYARVSPQSESRSNIPAALDNEGNKAKTIVVLVDVDNVHNFASDAPADLPDGISIHCICGPRTTVRITPVIKRLQVKGVFHIVNCNTHEKNAADFALVTHAGVCHQNTAADVPFCIISGDRGFKAAAEYLENLGRKVVLFDPHFWLGERGMKWTPTSNIYMWWSLLGALKVFPNPAT